MNNLSRHGVDKEFSLSKKKKTHVGCNLAVRVGIVSESEGDLFGLSIGR